MLLLSLAVVDDGVTNGVADIAEYGEKLVPHEEHRDEHCDRDDPKDQRVLDQSLRVLIEEELEDPFTPTHGAKDIERVCQIGIGVSGG